MLDWKQILQKIPNQGSLNQLVNWVVSEVANALAEIGTDQTEEKVDSSGGVIDFAAVDMSLFGDLSHNARHSGLHESIKIRNHWLALRLARQVLTPRGEIDSKVLHALTANLADHLYTLDPLSPADSEARTHILSILQRLAETGPLRTALLNLTAPTHNRLAEQRIRESLDLDKQATITNLETRTAALMTVLSFFRQNVGSCFATAPGIIIQRKEPERVLQDLKELFEQGKLSRYFGGSGLEVPFSRSAGVGDFNRTLQANDATLRPLLLQVAHSPAIQTGLSVSGLLMDQSLSQRIQQIADWCMAPASALLERNPHEKISIEQLIRWIALNAHGLREKDLLRHQQRPDPVIRDGILVQSPFLDAQAPECDACLNTIEVMTSVFKRYGENPLLKVWEYTLASLTDHQSGFTKTNLYHSLGLDPKANDGIGRIVENSIQRLLDRYNDIVENNKRDHRRWVLQAEAMERRMHTATGDLLYTLQVEFGKIRGRLGELAIEAQAASRKTHYLSRLFNELMGVYFDLFADYFQEIYDPELHAEKVDEFADSPAGFRLYFKNAREDSSQWIAIEDEKGFLLALQEFFRSSEAVVLENEPVELHEALRELVTEVMNELQQPPFMQMAKQRLAQSNFGIAAPNQLRTPWAYVSGGSVDKLLGAYLKLQALPEPIKINLPNARELFLFLIREMRIMRESRVREPLFSEELILCSPTHAFVFQPYIEPFSNCWQVNDNAEQWLMTQLVQPADRFFSNLILSEKMQEFILQQLVGRLTAQSIDITGVIASLKGRLQSNMSASEFAKLFADLQRSSPKVISVLTEIYYQQLPLIPVEEIALRVQELLEVVGVGSPEVPVIVEGLVKRMRTGRFIGCEELQYLALLTTMLVLGKVVTAKDYKLLIATAAREKGLAPPGPMLFADSNWYNWKFGFLLNPVTRGLEVWQSDRLGHGVRLFHVEWGREWQLYQF